MAKKKLTQVQLVMRHLINRGSITQEQALRLYGIGRLAARIKDIRSQPPAWYATGIKSARVKFTTRQGRGGTFVKYSVQVTDFEKELMRMYWGL